MYARVKAANSLLRFTEYSHPSWQSGAHHQIVCDALEAVERGECSRLMIFAPPRHGKTEMASRRFPSWYLGRHPDRQVIACSYNSELATDVGRDVRNILKTQEYKNIFGDVLADDSQSAERWATKRLGRYIGTGIQGTITGRGAHLGLIDDPHKNREEAESQRVRDSIWDWYRSTFYTRLMPRGAIVVMMTRWHDDDLAGRLLQTAGWKVIELPALSEEGAALWPEWFPKESLLDIKKTVGPREWSALYQQRPQVEEGDYFKREWFHRYVNPPKHLHMYISSDSAVSKDGDYNEHAVWGIDPAGDIYAIDWWGKRAMLDESVDALIDLIEKWQPMMVIGEKGVIQKAMEPFLMARLRQRRVFANLQWVTRTGDKPAMARSFQARASMGTVYFPMTDWAERVISQLTRFPASVLDDAVDACANLGMALDSLIPGHEPIPVRKIDTTDAWGRVREAESWQTF